MAIYLVQMLSFLRAHLVESWFPVTRHFSPVFGIPWSGLILSVLLLLFAGVLHLTTLRQLPRRAARRFSKATHFNWILRSLRALERPLFFLIWTAAVGLVVLSLTSGDGQSLMIAQVVASVVNAVAFVSLFWFLFVAAGLVVDRFRELLAPQASPLEAIVFPVSADALRGVLIVIGFYVSLEVFGFSGKLELILGKLGSILMISVVTWFLIRLTLTLDSLAKAHFRLNDPDNLTSRKIYTQVHVIQKVLIVFISIVALASTLMLFDEVRKFGTTILASAGLAGVIFGFAAQQTIANLFAGVQIALTQPIRLDDVVIVEGEWGKVEEISLTYVVVCIWDLRRLVVPISYFINKPFQNWTRESANILGTIMVYVDYSVPVQELREAAQGIVQKSPLWDKKTFGVQVTNLSEKTMEVRILVSASDASKAWDLRCEVREKIIDFIQRNYEGGLPLVRVAFNSEVLNSQQQTMITSDSSQSV